MDTEPSLREKDLSDVTQWLSDWHAGDESARERVFAWVYPLARTVAGRRLARHAGHDLDTTQLAHDTLLRLIERPALYAHREHFLKVISIATRQIWIDHIRAKRSDKRGGDVVFVTVEAADDVAAETGHGDGALLTALTELERLDARKRQVVDMHHLLGLERADIARLIGISIPTVDRDLAFARAWLKAKLAE